MRRRIFHIDITYATAGIISNNGIIINAAPIFKWMVGKTLKEVKSWLLSKNAKVSEV